MIEHPEAVTLARQIAKVLGGKEIRAAIRGNSPHKFAFYSRSPEEYAEVMQGETIAGSEASGSLILTRLGGGHLLVLGGGGERLRYHTSAATVPAKHQLLLEFTDDTFLSVSVQGWGSCQLYTPEELDGYWWYAKRALEPTAKGFTAKYFTGLFAALEPGDARSVKYFLISEPGVWGLGNGYLQDILLAARLHPRCRAVDLTRDQQQALYQAIKETIKSAIGLRGRTDEYDLYDEPGGYQRRLSAAAVGQPCPACGQAAIVKESFLGGAVYTCPQCQPAPPKPERRAAKKQPS